MFFLDIIEALHRKSKIKKYKKLINGSNYELGDKVEIVNPQNITIGVNSYINGGNLIASPNAHIIIYNN